MLVSLVGLFWLILAGRLVHLQWWSRAELARHANRQRSYVETIRARPGEILDRNGRLLATSVTLRSLYVVPSQIEDAWPVVTALGDALHLNPDRLFEEIAAHRRKEFLWIKRRISNEEAERVRKLQLPDEIWGFRDEFARRYPQGALAAHVLGLRDIDGIGRGGVEQSLDAVLRGKSGKRVLTRDARGRIIEVRDDASNPPERGRTVVLTIDSVIQLYAERELDALMDRWKPRGATAIVLDPQTAEILAMASRPAFNPNNPANVPDAAWKNRAIAAIYEPGSTFKPFVVAAAVDRGLIARDEIFDCENGAYRMGRRVLHDHHPYGPLSVTDILVKSSNIGMAKIGERLTNRGLYETALLFGFGSKTGIELPGELSGILRPLPQWNSYSTGSIPMGQELATTPLQLITAHAALANGGTLTTPRIIKEIRRDTDLSSNSDTPRPQPIVTSATVQGETARWIVQGPMVDVVRRGTGTRAQLDGYAVFGKSGTAQKPDPATGAYSSQLHVSSFLCGAPAKNPRVLVLVVVDEPSVGKNHYGGTIAAPTAAEILRKTLIHLRISPNTTPLQTAETLPADAPRL